MADLMREGHALNVPADGAYGLKMPPIFVGVDSMGNEFSFRAPENPRCLLMWRNPEGAWVNDAAEGYPSPTLEVFQDLARQGAFAP